MSDSSGSILQLQTKITALSNVNLLIATANPADFHDITASLYAAEIDFTYDIVTINELDTNLLYAYEQYSAVIYNYVQATNEDVADTLVENLQWWRHLYPDAPLILITNYLGDERAVELIQAGVSGYVLKQKLYQLPDILAKTLSNFAKQQNIANQQNLIKQQQKKIQQLEIERQSWLDREQLNQEHIAHLNHELRNPISSMLGFAGMLKEQYYGTLNCKQMQYVSALLSVSGYMLDLVNNYLDLVKIDANKQILEIERLAVAEICQASLFIVTEKARQKGLNLIFNLEDNIDFCTADSVRLKQILVNLLNNAIKFTDRGSVTLEVKLKADWLHFSVIDTGMGISPQNLSKLFQPFPQITNNHESTGLGLTVSKKIAQLHQGDITVTSSLGKGSCFTLCIPQYQ
ncbi:sensor histidine kinase [Pleurocapsa sp. FMAR1]|uniref:sensor histidine kinase n=1 Tax=Pleurocapsa sp. FMAR1 TaxID=3040204 RepID=UPI0029C7E68F|nr:hybrid sensor histidine kinase/response regulator [Pleurocapsa sp. FMAR1]